MLYQVIMTILRGLTVVGIVGAVTIFGVGAVLISIGPKKASQNMPNKPQLTDIEVVTEKGVEIC